MALLHQSAVANRVPIAVRALDRVAVRRAQVGYVVQRDTADEQVYALSFKAT